MGILRCYIGCIELTPLAQCSSPLPTLKTMCSSMLRPALPGYLAAMLAGVRSNMLDPDSVQTACTRVFFPTPLGPVIIRDLT